MGPRVLLDAEPALVQALFTRPPHDRPLPLQGHGPSPSSAHRVPRAVFATACISVLIILVVVGIASSSGSTPAAPLPAPDARPITSVQESEPLDSPVTVAPAEMLAVTASRDEGDLQPVTGTWVPQVSSKSVGLEADGRVYDAASILADHEALRAQHADARLLRSADYSTFARPDFWVTVIAQSYPTADAANAWCDTAGLARSQCYAKLLSHSASPKSSTKQRTG